MDTPNADARMVGVLHLAPDPLAAAAARPSRIPHLRPAPQMLALTRLFEPRQFPYAAPGEASSESSRRLSPASSRSSSRAGYRARSTSPEVFRNKDSLSPVEAKRQRRPFVPRTSSSSSTIQSKLPKANDGGPQDNGMPTDGEARVARAAAPCRDSNSRAFVHRSGNARHALPGHKHGRISARVARPVGHSQSTSQVFHSIRNAINDSDEDNASVDESGGADDEFDDDHDGPEMDEEGEAAAQIPSPDVHASSAPVQELPQLSRAGSSSMSDALVFSHDSKSVAISDATNDAATGCTPIPSPSPASADVSTFPKFSEGESSGTERKSLFNTFTSLWNYRNGDFAPLAYPT